MDAKQKIILATLDIIKTDGMRAVRHRAVAAKAQVSLGSTTYHFKDLEDLISSAFIYWHERADVNKNPYFVAIKAKTESMQGMNISPEMLADTLVSYGEDYMRDQIFARTDDRRIELAFHNEALRSDKLSKLMLESWQEEVALIEELYTTLGISEPHSSAEVTFALILQLEKKALLIRDKEAQNKEWEKMRMVYETYIASLVGLT